jgi:helicase
MRAKPMAKGLLTDISFLHLVCSTPDVRFTTVKKDDQFRLINYVSDHEDEFLLDLPTTSFELELFMSQLKTALILKDWIAETPEDTMLDRYKIGSGDIYSVVANSEWLLYATSEIAKLLGHNEIAERTSILHNRIVNGIKGELVDLVLIPGIGRVRARILFDKGYKTREILKQTKPSEIIKLSGFGKELVKSIYSNLLGEKFVEREIGPTSEEEKAASDILSSIPQKSLDDFFSK